MSLALTNRKAALLAPWNRNPLWSAARAVPSLDLRFAESKSLTDAATGANLVTFTRASSGTYVDSQGVIRNAVTNLLPRSEEFDNASWAKARCSITQNAIAAPNGSITADLLIEDTSLNTHRLLAAAATVTANSTVTFSAYFKSKERTQISLYVDEATGAGGVAFAAFFSETGVSGGAATGGATYTSGSVQAIGDGWYRAVIIGTLAGGYTSYRCSIFPAVSGTTPYQGDGTSGIYIWGAQLEQSSTVGEYIPTGATINSAPRFDHNPTTGESLGLLVEEQRTNSIRNNTMQGAVAGTPGTLPTNWSTYTSLTGLTREVVGTGSEDGITYVDLRVSGTPSAAGNYDIYFDSSTAVSAATAQVWTLSRYVRLVSGSATGINGLRSVLIEYTAAGAYVTQGNEALSTPASTALRVNRSAFTRTLNGGATVGALQPLVQLSLTGAAIDITLRIGLPQLEQGAFATSVIPTTGTAATRSADVASITGTNFSSWYRQDEGTVFVEGAAQKTTEPAGAFLELNDTTVSNQVDIRQYRLDPFVCGGGSATVTWSAEAQSAINPNVVYRQAVGYSPSSHGSAISGAIRTSSSAIGSIAATRLMMFMRDAQTSPSGGTGGTIRRITYWPQRLPNSTLQDITR